MFLLTPTIVKDIKKEEEEKTRLRVSELARSESDIVFKLNLARQEDVFEREKITIEFDELKKATTEKKTALLSEIKGLEDRRAEAMKPVDALILEAQNTLKTAKTRLGEAETAQSEISAKEIAVTVRETNVSKRESDVEALRLTYKPREDVILEREKTVEDSEKLLNQKWDLFHKAVEEQARFIARAEVKIKVDSIANENEKNVLDERKKTYDAKDREIADRYAQLEKTAEEVRNMKKS